MKRLLSFSVTVLMGFCVMVASERRAWAYVDPGAGMFALQTAASAAAACLYFLRRRIRALFRPSDKEPKPVAPASDKASSRRAV